MWLCGDDFSGVGREAGRCEWLYTCNGGGKEKRAPHPMGVTP